MDTASPAINSQFEEAIVRQQGIPRWGTAS